MTSPYLMPNPEGLEEIREGRRRGLKITLVTNSLASTDEPLVHAGYQRYRRQMLELGVKLYEVVPRRCSRAKDWAVRPVDRAPACQGGGDRRQARCSSAR